MKVIFWALVALIIGILLARAYAGSSPTRRVGFKVPKFELGGGAFPWGKAVKLGLLLTVVLFIEFYPWLESWGKVTPVTFITGLLAKLSEADRGFILMLVHLLPWVVAGFIAWHILAKAPATTDPKAKPSKVGAKTYTAFLVAVVGITLIAVGAMFFGGASGDAPEGKNVVFDLVRHESLRQTIGVNTQIQLILPRSPVSARGEIRSAGCARIVAPEVAISAIRGDPIEILSPNQGRVFRMRLSEEVRIFLAKNQIPYIGIEFYRRQYNIETEPECP